jgi:hypothetical protein
MKPLEEYSLGAQCHRALQKAGKDEAKAMKCKRLLKRLYQRLYLETEGTVAEREAKTQLHEKYIEAENVFISAESDAIVSKAEADGLELMFEEWRTNQSTARAEMQLR